MTTPITLTDAAETKIASVLPQATSVLRISLKSGGCAGMSYQMDVLDAPKGDGVMIVRGAARVEVDPLVEMFLLGTEIDYRDTLLESGFVFRNPNATAACGCGTSVGF